MRGLKVPLVLGLLFRIYIRFLGPKPMILGQEVAGEIEAVGAAVTRFKPGDQVFGWTSLRMGAYAEYICLSEKGVLALKPAGLSYEEAAPFGVGGLEAVYFLQKADLQPGAKVLIYGAGGSIGTFAVQLARHWGAEVTAVDRAEKLGMLRALGADHVIDSRREDFTKNGGQYDVIFDVIGKTPFARSLRSLGPMAATWWRTPGWRNASCGAGGSAAAISASWPGPPALPANTERISNFSKSWSRRADQNGHR